MEVSDEELKKAREILVKDNITVFEIKALRALKMMEEKGLIEKK